MRVREPARRTFSIVRAIICSFFPGACVKKGTCKREDRALHSGVANQVAQAFQTKSHGRSKPSRTGVPNQVAQ
eukprot:800938-Pleurochrysis_carterae.AAC.1